jgi:alpha-L-fucosidase
MSKAPPERLAWFRQRRFGLFVHWGMSAAIGRGEQIMARDLMPLSEYEPYAQRFRPRGDWAELLAESAAAAGAKYVVLTTRHHDGYCLFDTATHDFNAAKTGPARDLVAEYVRALRRRGLGVGMYYSLLNWRWRCYWSPDRYAHEMPAMVAEAHQQVRELMENYGPIDILWYDGSQVPGTAGHGMWGGHPVQQSAAEYWRSEELNAAVRRLQPDILINNRAGTAEDFGTPEQVIRSEGPDRPWEACMTLNFPPGWGYLRHSLVNKTAAEVLYHLVDAVRMGGNFLFNVGPRADGTIDDREAAVLEQIGRWLRPHGQAIFDTRPAGIYDLSRSRVQGPMFHYGMWTCRDSTGYLTLFYYPGQDVVISKIRPGVVSARLLTTGEPLKVERISNGRTRLSGLPETPPAGVLACVVQVQFEGPPQADPDSDAAWLDGEKQ